MLLFLSENCSGYSGSLLDGCNSTQSYAMYDNPATDCESGRRYLECYPSQQPLFVSDQSFKHLTVQSKDLQNGSLKMISQIYKYFWFFRCWVIEYFFTCMSYRPLKLFLMSCSDYWLSAVLFFPWYWNLANSLWSCLNMTGTFYLLWSTITLNFCK